MSARFLVHLGFLTCAVLLTFLWTKNPFFSPYTLQLIALLIIFYFLNKRLSKVAFEASLGIDGLILSLVTLLLVSQSGGLSSPLFFLIYILLFGLAFLFDPLIIAFFTVFLVLLFYSQIQTLSSLLQVIGLLLMTPLALFFGRQYLKVLEEEQKIQILKKEKKVLSQEVSQQEEDTLLWLSLPFREHVVRILDATSQMLADLSRLSPTQKEALTKIHQSAKRLLSLGEKLGKKIED